MMKAFKSGNLTKAKADFDKLFSHLRDAQSTAKTMVAGRKSIQVTRSGGMRQAQKEFRQMLREHGIDPQKMKSQGNGVYSAVLPDGSNISIRPSSSRRPGHPDGLPTIQIVPPKGQGKMVTIRYE